MLCSLCTISSSDLGFSLTFTLTVRDRWEPGTDLLISFVKGYKTEVQHVSLTASNIYLLAVLTKVWGFPAPLWTHSVVPDEVIWMGVGYPS